MRKRTPQETTRCRRLPNKYKQTANMSESALFKPKAPPSYKAQDHITSHHDYKRNDKFYWLHERSNRNVKKLLRAENNHTEHFFTLADRMAQLTSTGTHCTSTAAPTLPLRRKLFKEMSSRMRPNDISLPSRERSYWYYSRHIEHEEHPLLCRRPYCAAHSININFAEEVSALWEVDPNAPLPHYDDEEIYLDLNLLKEQLHLDYIDVGDIDISHNERQLALTLDCSSGKEVFTVLVINISHVDYHYWLKHYAHTTHRAWAEQQCRAGQTVYGSPTRRSPLFASVANAAWHRTNVSCDTHSNNNNNNSNNNNNNKNDFINNCKDKYLPSSDKETNTCDVAETVLELSSSLSESLITPISPSNDAACLNNGCKSNCKTSSQRERKQTTQTKATHLPFHDIVCIIDDTAIGDEVMWANETHLLYFALDDKMRPYQLIYHTLPTHQPTHEASRSFNHNIYNNNNNNNDNRVNNITTSCTDSMRQDNNITVVEECDSVICYEEDDEAFWLGGLSCTADEQYCVFTSSSSEQSESYVCQTVSTPQCNFHTDATHKTPEIATWEPDLIHKHNNCTFDCHASRPYLANGPIVNHTPHELWNETSIDTTCTSSKVEQQSKLESSITYLRKKKEKEEEEEEEEHLSSNNADCKGECELQQTAKLSSSSSSSSSSSASLINMTSQALCFTKRPSNENDRLEYEIDHHACLLPSLTDETSSGAWVIVSNAHNCINHAVFLVPDSVIKSNRNNEHDNNYHHHNNNENNGSMTNGVINAPRQKCMTGNKELPNEMVNTLEWQMLIEYDDAVKVEHVECFRDFLLISVRRGGTPTVLFCPVTYIHHWWRTRNANISNKTINKCATPISISDLTDLQDVIIAKNLQMPESHSVRERWSFTLHQCNTSQSILDEHVYVEENSNKETCSNIVSPHEERNHNNMLEKNIASALESVTVSKSKSETDKEYKQQFRASIQKEEEHLEQREEEEQEEEEWEQHEQNTYMESQNMKEVLETASQSSIRLSPLPFYIEAMGFTNSFHECEFRILVLHMIKPFTYYHVRFNKSHELHVDAKEKYLTDCLLTTQHNYNESTLHITRMCQEVVLAAKGESLYRTTDYDGAVMWVPSNYAFHYTYKENKREKNDENAFHLLEPLPTAEFANVVDIPVFMCWKRLLDHEREQEHEEQNRKELFQINDKYVSRVPIRDVLLRVYGSYGDCIDPCFTTERLTLLNRGFIVAAAALRGGGEFGIKWRDAGRKLQRATTVNDLLSVSQFIRDYLQHYHYYQFEQKERESNSCYFKYEEKEEEQSEKEQEEEERQEESKEEKLYERNRQVSSAVYNVVISNNNNNNNNSKSSNDNHCHLIVSGDSAGGFVVMRTMMAAPYLFHAVIASVPFVDCLTTLLDESLPLTITEWEEFGNPLQDKAAYNNIAMLSPYEAVDELFIKSTAKEQEQRKKRESNENKEITKDYEYSNDTSEFCALPHLFMLTDWNDTRVGYWESLKLTAKLRSLAQVYNCSFSEQDMQKVNMLNDRHPILLHYCQMNDGCGCSNGDDDGGITSENNRDNSCTGKVNNSSRNVSNNSSGGGGGHCGPTGRYEELRELAREYAFALIVCGKWERINAKEAFLRYIIE